MNLQQFWNIIEDTWKDVPALYEMRNSAIQENDEELIEAANSEIQDGVFMENLEGRLANLDKADLADYIRHLEERMYHLDRKEIQKYTDGSDDGFLYCRCFIVAMGEAYYNMIDKDPSKAAMDMEAEGFGFIAYGIYEDKFDEDFDRYKFHSMESGSNAAQWKKK